MSLRNGVLAVATWVIVFAVTARASPGDSGWPTVRQLPTTAAVEKYGSYGFKVKPATRNDLDGQSTHGIPAWWVTESISGQGWDTGEGWPTPPPNFVMDAASVLRSKIALFNGNTGWLAIPRGWRVAAGGIGVAGGGNSLLFVAPGGAQQGWVAYYDAGAGIGSVFGAADGLFPGAHRRYDDFIHTVTPELSLSPKPASLQNPDRCTALLSYRSGNLIVKGVALRYWDDKYDPDFVSFFVALPKQDAALQDFLIAAFRAPSPTMGTFCPPTGYYRQHARSF